MTKAAEILEGSSRIVNIPKHLRVNRACPFVAEAFTIYMYMGAVNPLPIRVCMRRPINI